MSDVPARLTPESVGPPRPPGATGVPADPLRPARGFVRVLYTHNPFYVISAGLTLWGLYRSFDVVGTAVQADTLLCGLAGYTLLLAAAAVVLIRVGKVWDDVRTILLLMVFLFLATSVTFDRTLTADPDRGRLYFFAGFGLSLLVSEAVLLGIRLRLPVLFRLPYYLILALFFCYPVTLSPYVDPLDAPQLSWRLFAFAPLAGACLLTLLPAVWRGAAYVRDNGSPWPWPLYPWSLFVFLALAVCGRAYSMCVSFYPAGGWSSVFGPYFLVPFLLAVCVVVFEIGRTARHRGAMIVSLLLPIGLVGLAAVDTRTLVFDLGFRATLTGALGGTPVFLTLLAVTAFYSWAMIRRGPGGAGYCTLALLALCVCGPATTGLHSLVAPQPLPLAILGLLHAAIAVRRPTSARWFFATACLLAAGWLTLAHTPLLALRNVIVAHALLAAVLLIAACFRDDFARFLRVLGVAAIVAAGLAALAADPHGLGDPPRSVLVAYPLVMAATAVAYRYLAGARLYLAAAVGLLAAWAVISGSGQYFAARRQVSGLDQMCLGAAFFLVALLISLRKAGLAPGWPTFRRWLAHL